MDLVIDFSPEQQSTLEGCAAREGVSPEQLALKALRLFLQPPPKDIEDVPDPGGRLS